MNRLMARLAFLWLVITACLLLSFAQATSTETLRPTAEADDNSAGGCSGTNLASSAFPNFYDGGGEVTSTANTVISTTTLTRWKQRKFTTWATTTNTYTSLNLKGTMACDNSQPNVEDALGLCVMQYSTNAGGAWTTMAAETPTPAVGQTTYSVVLSAAQNLSTLQVRICEQAAPSSVSTVSTTTLTGYDIRTEGTYQVGVPAHRTTTTH